MKLASCIKNKIAWLTIFDIEHPLLLWYSEAHPQPSFRCK